MSDVLRANVFATGATDDAAAAGQIFPAAGVYQAHTTVDEVNDGDVGRLRMSIRRGLITNSDYRHIDANNTSVASAGDMLVSTTSITSGYGNPTTAFFDGVAMGAGARYVAIPMIAFKSAFITVLNSALGVNLTVALSIVNGGLTRVLYSAILANNAVVGLGDLAGGTGTDITTVAALGNVMGDFLYITFTPASDPGAGGIFLSVERR